MTPPLPFRNGDRIIARLDGELVAGAVKSQRFTSKRDSMRRRQFLIVSVQIDTLPTPIEFYESELHTDIVDLLASLDE